MSELAKAILAAAEKDFSTFSDVVGDAAEEKFAVVLADKVKEGSEKVFEVKTPEYQQAVKMGKEILGHRKSGNKEAEKDSMNKLSAHVKKHKLNRHLTMPGIVPDDKL